MADFMTQVGRIYRTLETREEIVAYFKKEYPGSKYRGGQELENWKPALAQVLQPFTKAKKGGPQSKESVMRRFQSRKGKSWEASKPSPRQQAEYKALGATLPKQPPKWGYHVEGTICVKYIDPDGNCECEPRDWNYSIVGEWKDKLFATGSLEGIFNLYMTGNWDQESTVQLCYGSDECENADAEECNDNLVVTELTEEEYKNGTYPEIAAQPHPVDKYFPNREKPKQERVERKELPPEPPAPETKPPTFEQLRLMEDEEE